VQSRRATRNEGSAKKTASSHSNAARQANGSDRSMPYSAVLTAGVTTSATPCIVAIRPATAPCRSDGTADDAPPSEEPGVQHLRAEQGQPVVVSAMTSLGPTCAVSRPSRSWKWEPAMIWMVTMAIHDIGLATLHGHSPGATGFPGGGFLPIGRLASGGTAAQTTRKASRHSAPSTTSGHSTPLAAPISAMPLAQFLVPATVGSRRHAMPALLGF